MRRKKNHVKPKIDFVVLVTATNANPNGGPLDGNRPRTTLQGLGEISDVCIKRKIRNRLQDMGERVFVQSAERCDDGCDSLEARVKTQKDLTEILTERKQADKKKDKAQNQEEKPISWQDKFIKRACKEWIDVRSFGQVFAWKQDSDSDSVSISVRGPVSICQAESVSPIDIVTMQITKSVNGPAGVDGKSKDTMGEKHYVPFGLYVIKGSINCQLAEKTGFSDEDAQKIKQALCTLFENDASAARPDGSMEVRRVYWWEHGAKTPNVSSAAVHRSVKIKLKDGVTAPRCYEDYDITNEDIGIEPEIIDPA